MLTVLDLFSGIGGFSLGLERAGMQTIAFCEIEPYCQKVLKQHWPDVPIFNDIKKLTTDELPAQPDVVCGGYPCQPFSVAGKQRGEEDDRHLWPEMYRIIRETVPKYVVAENVAGHIKMGLDAVLSDLENEGYTPWPFIIPACALDARHRRDRVWMVAYTQSQRVKGFRSSRQRQLSTHVQQKVSCSSGERSEQPCWETEPTMGRVVNGLPNRVDRIKALGNAVVPQIPQMIGEIIIELNNETIHSSLY